MIDDIDLEILAIIQDCARTNNAEIARQVGMAPSAVLERVRKLEKRGIIECYSARLSPHAIGLSLLAFVYVKTNEALDHQDTGEKLAAIPGVQEVHHVAGKDCYLIKVRARDPQALGKLLRGRLGQIPSVVSTRSTIVLDTVKESGWLPLPASSKGDDDD